MMNKEIVFKQLLATMNEIYDKPLTQQAQDIWWNMLKPYSAEELNHAMQAHLKDPEAGRFAPKPADIIGKIEGTTKQIAATNQQKAIDAWEYIVTQIRKVGSYVSFSHDDPKVIQALKFMGGWISLCQTNEDKMEWRRKEFISAYMNAVESESAGALPGIGQQSQDKQESKAQLSAIYQRLGE